MKYKTLLLTAVLATSFALSGCEQVKKLIGGKPEGQVVATVNGEEITAIQLRQEMGNFASRDPKIMKAAQQRALEGLILRKVLVQQAKEQKLDKSADYAVQVSRGEDNLMVQTFQRKIASGNQPTERQPA